MLNKIYNNMVEWVLISNPLHDVKKTQKSEGKLLFNSFPLLYKLSNNHEM